MCTTAAKKLNDSWVLAKTRDPVTWMRWDDEIKLFDTDKDKFKKLIIQNPNPKEDGFYGGMNEKGVAVIATFVNVDELQISYLRKPYIRLILDASSAKAAVEIVKAFNPRIGGNIFIADEFQCFGIEAVPDQYYIEEIKTWSVKTNHFTTLPHQNLSFKKDLDFEKWSHDHQDRAEDLTKQANSIADFKLLLTDRFNAHSKTAICTTSDEDECFTHSAFIFDTKNKMVHYAQGNPLEVGFKEYGF